MLFTLENLIKMEQFLVVDSGRFMLEVSTGSTTNEFPGYFTGERIGRKDGGIDEESKGNLSDDEVLKWIKIRGGGKRERERDARSLFPLPLS